MQSVPMPTFSYSYRSVTFCPVVPLVCPSLPVRFATNGPPPFCRPIVPASSLSKVPKRLLLILPIQRQQLPNLFWPFSVQIQPTKSASSTVDGVKLCSIRLRILPPPPAVAGGQKAVPCRSLLAAAADKNFRAKTIFFYRDGDEYFTVRRRKFF
ncbi:hypothetical protein GPALN_006387 [Globodera pallida]|nr:hypothetical protein GPALN_006387 [Globodera pallida]